MNKFESLMTKHGIPITDDAIQAEFKKVASEKGTDLNNDDFYSPFWSLLFALCVYPAKVLIKYVHTNILPNLYIETAVDEYLDSLGWAYKSPRKQKQKTKGVLKFRRLSGSGTQNIGANTIIQSNPIKGVVYKLATVESARFNDGDIEIEVLCEALDYGSGHNLGGGFYTVLPESIPGIKSVTNSDGWIVQLGADRESNDDYRLRLRDLFSLLNHYHVDEVYRSIITSHIGISPKNVFFDKATPRGPGSADALILLDHGVVGDELLAKINKHIRDDGNHGIGDDLLTRAIDTNGVDLNIQVYVDGSLSDDEKDALKLQFENYVGAAFRKVDGSHFTVAPPRVEPFKRFSFSALGGKAHREFVQIESIDFNSDDLIHELNVSELNVLNVSILDAD